MTIPLAWIPLIDPLYSVAPHLTHYWLALVAPVTLLISLVYQTVRRPDRPGLTAATLWLSVKILLGMAAVSAATYGIYYLGVHYGTGVM